MTIFLTDGIQKVERGFFDLGILVGVAIYGLGRQNGVLKSSWRVGFGDV